VLDIMLPGKDGLSILRNLRDRKLAVPVILLTARSELNERLEGLNLGADDYLTKPFFIEELIARLHVVTRRASGASQSILAVEDLTVNLLTREVTRAGRKIDLTAREFALLESLMRSPGRVLTRAQICEQVWDYNFDPGTNLVEVYVQRLRKKVDGEAPVKLIETIRGVGYRMKGRE
jgi:two-component system OmpR family response regulator